VEPSPAPTGAEPAVTRGREVERRVELLGRAVPVVQTDEGLWALLGGEVVRAGKAPRD